MPYNPVFIVRDASGVDVEASIQSVYADQGADFVAEMTAAVQRELPGLIAQAEGEHAQREAQRTPIVKAATLALVLPSGPDSNVVSYVMLVYEMTIF